METVESAFSGKVSQTGCGCARSQEL